MRVTYEENLKRLQLGLDVNTFFLILYGMEINEDKRIRHVFKELQISRGEYHYSFEDFKRVRDSFLLVASMNLFSLIKDEYLSIINNNELDNIDFDFRKIFVDQSMCNRFSKKKIILYIRNALSHSNHNVLYKILDDNRIEIKLEKTNPPFHVIVSTSDLLKISDEILNKTHYFSKIIVTPLDKVDIYSDNLKEELKNIKINRVFVSKSIIGDNESFYKNVFRDIGVSYFKGLIHGGLDSSNYSIVPQNGAIFNIYEYDLNNEQIETIYNQIRTDIESGYSKDDINARLDAIVRQLIPFGISNEEYIEGLIYIVKKYMNNWSFSLKKIFDLGLDDVITDKRKFLNNNDFSLINRSEKIITSLAVLSYYMFANYDYTDDYKEDKDLEKIRNSFVHGRWSIYYENQEKMFMLYDCENGIENENNYNWSLKISFDEIVAKINKLIMSEGKRLYCQRIDEEYPDIIRKKVKVRDK